MVVDPKNGTFSPSAASNMIAAAHVDGFTSFEASLQRFYGPDSMHLTINDDHDVDEAPYMRSQILKSGVPQGIQHNPAQKIQMMI